MVRNVNPTAKLVTHLAHSTQYCRIENMQRNHEHRPAIDRYLNKTYVLTQSRLLLVDWLILQLGPLLRLQIIVLNQIQIPRPDSCPRCSVYISLSLVNSVNTRASQHAVWTLEALQTETYRDRRCLPILSGVFGLGV